MVTCWSWSECLITLWNLIVVNMMVCEMWTQRDLIQLPDDGCVDKCSDGFSCNGDLSKHVLRKVWSFLQLCSSDEINQAH